MQKTQMVTDATMQDTDLLFDDTCYYGTIPRQPQIHSGTTHDDTGRGRGGYNSRTTWHLSDTKGVNAQ